jgi:hypothetical protein
MQKPSRPKTEKASNWLNLDTPVAIRGLLALAFQRKLGAVQGRMETDERLV